VHLVLDNLKAHKTRLIDEWLVKHPRVQLHFTPSSASRLNLVECWFALLSRRRLARGAFTSTDDLEAAIIAYIAEINADPKPFVWTKTADDILARICQCSSNSGHWGTLPGANRRPSDEPSGNTYSPFWKSGGRAGG
jgi:hypothetical protein